MTSRTSTLAEGVKKWARQPSTWLSLGSVLFSVWTYLYLTFYWGSVTIYMPPEIAISLGDPKHCQFVANTSFVNSAPPNNLKIVEDARLTVRLENSSRVHNCVWIGTSELIPTQDFQRLYKDVPPPLSEIGKTKLDQLGPWHRKAPFGLHGGELGAKLLIFWCPELESTPVSSPTQVRATIAVKASEKWYPSPERIYQLSQELIDTSRTQQSWEWAHAR